MSYNKYTRQSVYLTAKEPEQRVPHIPPMVAPGPTQYKCIHLNHQIQIKVKQE